VDACVPIPLLTSVHSKLIITAQENDFQNLKQVKHIAKQKVLQQVKQMEGERKKEMLFSSLMH
jgi:hypothetical protein